MKHTVLIIFLVALIILPISGGLFYWYEYRPAEIRRECSWVRKTEPAKPGQKALSENELRERGMLKECRKPDTDSSWLVERVYGICTHENDQIISQYKLDVDPIPEKEWWEEAHRIDYEFCIKSKGIER